MTNHDHIPDKGAEPLSGVDMARHLSEENLKPSVKLVAKAILRDNGAGWVAQFSAPGLIPRFVTWPDGSLRLFDTEGEAEFDAMRAAISVFNSPRDRLQGQGRRFTGGGRPAKMKGGDLAAALRRHDMKPGDLAYIADKPVKRVYGWLDGTQDIPHEIRVLMAIFDQNDPMVDVAEDVTFEAIQEREKAG